jgi:hypothetical protein
MKLDIDWRIFFISVSIIALIAAAIAAVLHVNFWLCFGVAVISVLANGVFAEWEDRRPRGFLNPDPESPDPEGPETHRRVAEGN